MLTPAMGSLAAYVRGGRGRRMRPVLIRGNLVSAQLRSRTESQLPQAVIELAHSRAPIFSEPLPAGGIEWATSLVAEALPERQPYPRLYEAMTGLLDAIEAAPSASRVEVLRWLGSSCFFYRNSATAANLRSFRTGFRAGGRVTGTKFWPHSTFPDFDLFREILSGRPQSLAGQPRPPRRSASAFT
jgi:recombinational DNA repair protein (RecF pathway)